MGYHPKILKQIWPATVKAKEVKAIEQAPTDAQPTEVSTVPAQPMEVSPTPSPNPFNYCAICTPARKLSPNKYPMPIKSEWSEDSEDDKEFQELNKDKNGFWTSKIGTVIWKSKIIMTIRPPTKHWIHIYIRNSYPSALQTLEGQIWQSNNLPSSVPSEEGQNEETFEDSFEDVNWEICERNSVYGI